MNLQQLARLQRERDDAVVAANQLAAAAGRLLGIDFGEPGGQNDHWQAARTALHRAADADLRALDRHEAHQDTETLVTALVAEWRGPGPRAPHVVAHMFTQIGRVTFQIRGYPLQLAFIVDALRAYGGGGRRRETAQPAIDAPVHTPGSKRTAATPQRGPGSVYREDD